MRCAAVAVLPSVEDLLYRTVPSCWCDSIPTHNLRFRRPVDLLLSTQLSTAHDRHIVVAVVLLNDTDPGYDFGCISSILILPSHAHHE
jgi:hypothetical protein